MSFNFIYNPFTNEKYSIFSYEGKSLLKKYIKDSQTGGSEIPTVSEIYGDEAIPLPTNNMIPKKIYEQTVEMLGDCNEKLGRGGSEIPTVSEIYGDDAIPLPTNNMVPKKIYEQTVEMLGDCNEKLKLMETQPERAKSVEQKVNDEGDEPTYDFSIIEDGNENTFKMGEFEVKLNDVNKLGRGGSKIVYKIKHDKKTFALAKIPSEKIGLGPGGVEDKKVNDIFKNEIKCLENLKHPNIAKLYMYVAGKKSHFMLMEYGESNLTEMIGKALDDIELTHKFIINMASAISHLKKKNINHRDIKLENFIIVGESPNQVVKLIDFGISTRCPGTDGYSKEGNPMDVRKPDGPQKLFSSGGGTVFYIAPENAIGEPSTNTHSGDVFAFGLCILELFHTGDIHRPRTHIMQARVNMGSVENRIKKNFPGIGDLEKFYTKINESVFGGKPIIQGMLNPLPEEKKQGRTKIEEVLEALGVSEEDETEGDGGRK
jgi:hypothetical protein